MLEIKISDVQRAVNAAGSQLKLAKKLGCTQQFVSLCVKRGHFTIPHAIKIEGAYNIPRSKLVDPKYRVACADNDIKLKPYEQNKV